jgi:hypothetical protein
MRSAPRENFVYLAYMDDADTKCKRRRWQVMSAVIIEDQALKWAEVGVAGAQDILGLSPEQLEKFEEFHACELYGGYGVFQGIEQETRFDAMRQLLALLTMLDLYVVYGAVDLDQLGNEIYASADPLDICFRICAKGISICLDGRHRQITTQKLGSDPNNYTTKNIMAVLIENTARDLTLIIMDECDKKTKDSLHRTYRSMRPRANKMGDKPLSSFHDDMYFGDSKYSFGIQIADACSYFIARHLEGDHETERFYEIIAPRIVHYELVPSTKLEAGPSNAEFSEEVDRAEEQQRNASIRESDGYDTERRSASSEGRDGSGEAGKEDGSATNGQARTGQAT